MNYFEEEDDEEMEIDGDTLEDEIFLIDTLNQQPFKNVDIYIQCSEVDLTENLREILIVSEFAWGLKIKLTPKHKQILLSELISHHVHVWFANLEARLFNVKLFELYDGCEIGTFSKNLNIPKWFFEKYSKTGRFTLAEEW